MSNWQIAHNDPGKLAVIQMPNEVKQLKFVVITGNCFATKDGVWVQLLGPEVEKHLPPFLNAFGVKWSAYLKFLETVITEVLPSNEKNMKNDTCFCCTELNSQRVYWKADLEGM
jgi:hypothetical protein